MIIIPDVKIRANQVIPVRIRSILKVHLQPYLTEHPEIIGPKIGPKLQAWKGYQYYSSIPPMR